MTTRQLWVQETEYSAADDRLLLAALLPSGGTAGPFGSRVGLREEMDLHLAWTTGTTASISPGAAFIAMAGSIYLLVADAWTLIEFAPADPTLTRIDLVIAQVHDPEAGGESSNAEIRVIAGVPAVSPAPPAVPAGALVLSTVTYSPGAGAPSVTREVALAQRQSWGDYPPGLEIRGATPNLRLPFPEQAAGLGRGANDIQALAQTLDQWGRFVPLNTGGGWGAIDQLGYTLVGKQCFLHGSARNGSLTSGETMLMVGVPRAAASNANTLLFTRHNVLAGLRDRLVLVNPRQDGGVRVWSNSGGVMDTHLALEGISYRIA